ncbi:MAG TPA: SIR2 family protein [Plantibacter sp.]|uniref:SIR2 family protein n=1 Tax=unclassified Plantibacter TaxID=2624265 RepID=UPI002BB18378|nr:SIR2 family protein [Plantibacter sp.]
MSAPELTAAQMDVFRDAGGDRHVTLLLGAGASTSSGLPGWDELATRLLLKSGSVTDAEAAALLVGRQDPLLVAEAARNALGDRWDQQIRSALYRGLSDLSPSALHLAAAGHALAGPASETTLITLNFDTLLEDAAKIDLDDAAVHSRIDGSRPDGVYVVHHLHGIASTSHSEGVVLTLSDFNELLGNQDSWQQQILRESASQGAIVIAGTSYRDPDVRRWLHVALAEAPDENAAVVLLARQAFGVSRDQFSQLERALAEQWSSAGLKPVIVEDFTDAAQIIRELRYVHASNYRAPQERADAMWKAHVAQFADLQESYSDRLGLNASRLKDAFDVDHLNVTLWLADGNGSVARYAAQDRIYKSAEDLRHVESGHDSRWVAGRALGAEDIVFQDIEDGSTSRWGTVFAVPVRVVVPGHPEMAMAVISVGLPGSAATHFKSRAMWFDAALEIANDWSETLLQVIPADFVA